MPKWLDDLKDRLMPKHQSAELEPLPLLDALVLSGEAIDTHSGFVWDTVEIVDFKGTQFQIVFVNDGKATCVSVIADSDEVKIIEHWA